MTNDFILGQYFRDMADATFAPMPKSLNAWEEGDYDNLPNTFNVIPVSNSTFVVYTHTMYVHLLMPILADINLKFIVITHNSDCFVCDDGVGFKDGLGNHIRTEKFTIPENVIKWYSANVNTTHPKVEAIPTGLANEWWSPEIHKRDQMIVKWNEPRIYKNLVYMDHNLVQNPIDRKRAYEVLGDKPWVTAQREGLNFPKFLDNVYNHKFVICPQGNGMGTHREWETLYMGSIPIMKRDLNNRFYEGKLPFILVNDWDDITEEFLNKEYEIIKASQWQEEMLTFTYWKNKILNTQE
jgi:hypothetical protein